MNEEEWKYRVQCELTELQRKVDALDLFTKTENLFDKLSARQQDLLILQARAMHMYAVILRMRLESSL